MKCTWTANNEATSSTALQISRELHGNECGRQVSLADTSERTKRPKTTAVNGHYYTCTDTPTVLQWSLLHTY